MKTSIYILIMVFMAAGCGYTDTSSKKTEAIAQHSVNREAMLLAKQSESLSFSVAVVDDISGSYTLNPESRNLEILVRFFKFHNGRELLGYTNIQEDSYTPILRLSQMSNVAEKTDSEKSNSWIESENGAKPDFKAINATVDSLNATAYRLFTEKMNQKLQRSVAMRSDVVSALQRAMVFLNEAPKSPRVMVVCSDFKDTNNRSMNFDPSIKLMVVGNVSAEEVKLRTGLDPDKYQVFESYEEAFNQIVQLYNQ